MNPAARRVREALLRTPRIGPRGAGRTGVRAGEGYEFAELREYAPGDDVRRIDWAASARTGALQTRVYLDERALSLVAFADDSPSMRVGRRRPLLDAADEAVELWYAAAAPSDRAWRIGPAGEVRGSRHARGLHAARIALEKATGERPFTLEAGLRAAAMLGTPSALLVVSDFHDLDAVDEAILYACGARHYALALYARDPWHDDFPLRGFVRLRDAETGRAAGVYVTSRARKRYLRLVAEREASMLERLRRAGWRSGVLHEDDGRTSLLHALGIR